MSDQIVSRLIWNSHIEISNASVTKRNSSDAFISGGYLRYIVFQRIHAMTNSDGPSNRSRKLYRAMCFAGLVAGTLDGLAAVVIYLVRGGKNPVAIFNFIASGVFGDSGLRGGIGMAFMGLLFHFLIATTWSLIFFVVNSRVSAILRHWVLSGLVYGMVVWLCMNLVVVPLSFTPPIPMNVSGIITGILVLMICVGLPISFLAKKHFLS